MKVIAESYLYLMSAIFMAVGLAAVSAPEMVASHFDLLPKAVKGIAEIRGLYGGLFIALGLLTAAALRCAALAPGLLVAVGTIMGGIAAARLVSIGVDGEFAFSLPAAVAEALIALACRAIYRRA